MINTTLPLLGIFLFYESKKNYWENLFFKNLILRFYNVEKNMFCRKEKYLIFLNDGVLLEQDHKKQYIFLCRLEFNFHAIHCLAM